jgi:hypothetical protein
MQTTSKTYTARIDGGEGGDTTFTADSAAEALVEAIEWAKQGDWPDEGCDVDVTVENDADESDSGTETIHILSAAEKQNEKLDADGEVLCEDEGEFATKQVIRIAGEYYYRRNNGGSRGAYDHRTNPGVFECREITQREARKILLEFGLEPSEVAKKTEDR